MGNHHYNVLDIKDHCMLVEDPFFHNCSMSAVDVVADDNIAIRNNVL
jgi:hypothetical protein